MLITYVPAGDPVLRGERHLATYAHSGADVVEIGIPAQRPFLDGEVVAGSMARALDAGFDPNELAETIAAWKRDYPGAPSVVWMAYSESDLGDMERHVGIGALDGLLLVDGPRVPPPAVVDALSAAELGWCSFLPWDAPNSHFEALALTRGYVMVQTRPGTTGEGEPVSALAERVSRARHHAGEVPIVGGFGIRSQADVRAVIEADCDGIVVGSRCVEAMAKGADALAELVRDLRTWLVSEQARRSRSLYRGAGND